MMKNKVLILGSYSGNNKGDVAIAITIVENIYKNVKKIYIGSKDPAQFAKHVQKYSNVEVFKTVTAYLGSSTIFVLRKVDVIIIGGGELFFTKKLYNIFYNHLINLFILTLINNYLTKKKIIIYSVGGSSKLSKVGSLMTSYILSKASHIIVRDNKTRINFSKLTEKTIDVYYDPVLSLKTKISRSTINNTSCSSKSILICLNKATTSNATKRESIQKILSTLLKDNVVHVTENSIFAKNCHFLEKNSKLKIIHLGNATISEILGIICSYDLIISAPMHFSIFSFLLRKPTILLNYTNKIKQFSYISCNTNIFSVEQYAEIIDAVKSLMPINENIATKIATRSKAGLNKLGKLVS